MDTLTGVTALVTGASRGIGEHLARELARQGANLVLAARSETDLKRVERSVATGHRNTRVVVVPTDVAHESELKNLVARAEAELGPVDLLVNNAGTEQIGHFETLDPDAIERVVAVNLTAALTLTRLVLPGMLARGRGHIVNMASVAGLGGTAYNELYSATKHGLVGFTRSLRASLLESRTPVGASVICPGFISETGMFEALRRAYGVEAPPALGTSPPERVTRAVIDAVRGNLPDVVVNPGPTRLLLATLVLVPRVVEGLARALKFNEPFRKVADLRRRTR